MIDFRFFIISIVGVFLALGLGIVVGSGLLGEDLYDLLERRIEGVVEREHALREEVLDLEDQRDYQRDFLETLEPQLVNGRLAGEQIVVIEVEGTDSDLVDGVERVVEESDGLNAMEMTLTNRLRLEDESSVEDLAAILGSTSPAPTELRALLGRQLGDRLSLAAREPARLDGNRDRSQLRAREMLTQLESDGFVTFNGDGPSDLPQGSIFLLAGGASVEPPWPTVETLEPMAFELAAESGLGVIVAETSDSLWGITETIRDDSETPDIVSTVDNAETAPGRISVALALALAPETVGQWGNDEGAEAPVPTPGE